MTDPSTSVGTHDHVEKTAEELYMVASKPWDRVRDVFRLNRLGFHAFEYKSLQAVTLSSFFIGFLPTYVRESRGAREIFEKRNAATRFSSEYEALTRMRFYCMSRGVRLGIIRGLRVVPFPALTTISILCLAAYRNELQAPDAIGCVAASAGLYNLYRGPAAMAVGMGVGIVLGFVAVGGSSLLLMKTELRTLDGWYQRNKFEYFEDQLTKKRKRRDDLAILEQSLEKGDGPFFQQAIRSASKVASQYKLRNIFEERIAEETEKERAQNSAAAS